MYISVEMEEIWDLHIQCLSLSLIHSLLLQSPVKQENNIPYHILRLYKSLQSILIPFDEL